jgi:hypothetical protein
MHNFYHVKYYKHFTILQIIFTHKKLIHIVKGVCVCVCVYKYSLKATLNFALSLLRIARLHGKLLKICVRIKYTFFEKETGWYLVYEDGAYSMY